MPALLPSLLPSHASRNARALTAFHSLFSLRHDLLCPLCAHCARCARRVCCSCGAFSFSRQAEAIGWVAQSRLRGSEGAPFVEMRLLYSDEPRDAAGKAGVVLMPHRDAQGNPAVLVVEHTRSPEPPRDLPAVLTRYSSLTSSLDAYALPEPGQTICYDSCYVSCMPLRSLPPGAMCPPPELQSHLREMCAREAIEGDGTRAPWRKRGEMNALVAVERRSVYAYASAIGQAQREIGAHFGDEGKVQAIASALWEHLGGGSATRE